MFQYLQEKGVNEVFLKENRIGLRETLMKRLIQKKYSEATKEEDLSELLIIEDPFEILDERDKKSLVALTVT